jgi:hypothetical protein
MRSFVYIYSVFYVELVFQYTMDVFFGTPACRFRGQFCPFLSFLPIGGIVGVSVAVAVGIMFGTL